MFCFCIGGQPCVDTVVTQQRGSITLNTESQIIVPMSAISCTGRVTGYVISLDQLSVDSGDYPSIQVWRPTNPSLMNYDILHQYTLTQNDIADMMDYHLATVAFMGNNRIEVQTNDIIGYYLPNNLRYTVWNIVTSGYTSYSMSSSSPLSSFRTNQPDSVNSDTQPLIQVLFGNWALVNFSMCISCTIADIRCIDLQVPSNGEIISCSSGIVGVRYEGDTCSFTCNTGYELTGSDTRTCQNDGSWSGNDAVCRRGMPNYATLCCICDLRQKCIHVI